MWTTHYKKSTMWRIFSHMYCSGGESVESLYVRSRKEGGGGVSDKMQVLSVLQTFPSGSAL
jgi:hypothetical protein